LLPWELAGHGYLARLGGFLCWDSFGKMRRHLTTNAADRSLMLVVELKPRLKWGILPLQEDQRESASGCGESGELWRRQ
jgi:hypothetical protein